MSDMSNKIDSIIQKRKNSLEAVRKALNTIEQSYSCVEEFETVQRCIRQEGSSGKYAKLIQMNPEVAGIIGSISLVPFRGAYEAYKNELKILEERFSRDHLYISFVGRAGQGKSLTLQNISGVNYSAIELPSIRFTRLCRVDSGCVHYTLTAVSIETIQLLLLLLPLIATTVAILF